MDDYGFSDRETCLKSIRTARELMTSKKTTVAEWDALEKALGLMFLYCPDDLRSAVEATLIEADTRRILSGVDDEEPKYHTCEVCFVAVGTLREDRFNTEMGGEYTERYICDSCDDEVDMEL